MRPASRRRNHALWLGPLLTVVGALSYFTFFVRYPSLRDVPWVNLPLVVIGIGISLLGTVRAFGGPPGRLRRAGGILGSGLSVMLGGLFVWYVFVLSFTLPTSSRPAADAVSLPSLELVDQMERPVDLAAYRGQRVVLVFYRGFW